MTTKYDLGDKLFFIQENKIVCKEVNSICIEKTGIEYTFRESPLYMSFFVKEDSLFKTKEELIASL